MTIRFVEAPHVIVDWRERARLRRCAERRALIARCLFWFIGGFAFGFALCAGFDRAHADWKPQFADDGSEVVKTQFRVDRSSGQDEWYYLKDGNFVLIPPDIIHWGEHAPDGQPTLFVLSHYFGDVPPGTPTCFYPGEDGN